MHGVRAVSYTHLDVYKRQPKVDESTIQEITLVPYGDTGLRIGQFPVAEE